jgi:hypothetical protein
VGTIEQFRDLELAVARALTKLLRSYKERLAAQNRTYGAPEIEVRQSAEERYHSEIRVFILEDGNIGDVIEFDVYRDGQPAASEEELVKWFAEELVAVMGRDQG